MSTVGVILLMVLFCVLQVVFLKRADKKWKKYLPLITSVIGVMIGVGIYFIAYIPYLLNRESLSVLSENQYFALTICVLFTPCLIGSVLGILCSAYLKGGKILFFVPFIMFLVVYLVMAVTGFGMISVKEVIYLVLFLTGGILLVRNNLLGSAMGMIPAVIFIFMSTQYTGQVINIERPLGIILCAYFAGCGLWVCRTIDGFRTFIKDKTGNQIHQIK
mgnify:CR=1 FL=1